MVEVSLVSQFTKRYTFLKGTITCLQTLYLKTDAGEGIKSHKSKAIKIKEELLCRQKNGY